MPPKHVKLAADFLSKPLSGSINIGIASGIFPDVTKIAAVSSTDKRIDNKNIVSNF